MKLLLIPCLLLCVSACKPAEEAHTIIKEGAATGVAQMDRARVLSDLTHVTAALATWKLEHESYPATLSELGLKLNYPDDLTYDAQTGKVRSKTFPNL